MIPYGHQSISQADIDAVTDTLQGEWLASGPGVEAFERCLSETVGGAHVVAVSSGTAALHTAYMAVGILPGDEIITPPITFIATQSAAISCGAKVVFADVCDDTANIDPDSVESLIGERTRAIVAVDYAGHPAEMNRLREIANKYSLTLIEDAAHSLGSSLHGVPVGALADATAFSFYPTKNITTAEGGALATLDANHFKSAKMFARQGVVKDPKDFVDDSHGPWHQEVHAFGLNYRMPDVLAALGKSQISRLWTFKQRRADIKALYDGLLGEHSELRLPQQRKGVDPHWHLYPLRVPPKKRRAIFEYLRREGVGVQVNYRPVYQNPVFRRAGYAETCCPVAENFYASEISLPIWVGLSDDQVKNIAHLVLGALSEM